MKPLHTIEWTSPSNIALVKYWGKFGDQLPKNPSVSFTLKHAVTNMKLELFSKDPGTVTVEFLFDGKQNQKFQDKIQKYLEKEKNLFPWLERFHLKLTSSNTFPHSSGIASSASSMSALCLCLLSADEWVTGNERSDSEFF